MGGSASLRLLRAVVTAPDLRSFLFVGAYRSEEVGPNHLVTRTMTSIDEAGTHVDRLALDALDVAALGTLLSDALGAPRSATLDLARVVHKKTAGNPLFVRRFLGFLHREGALVHRARARHLDLGLAQIEAMEVTANVVDLLTSAITEPSAGHAAGTQRPPRASATHSISRSLAKVHRGVPIEEVAGALWPPLREGLLVPQRSARAWPCPETRPIELADSGRPVLPLRPRPHPARRLSAALRRGA